MSMLNGYILERISQGGHVEILRRIFDFDELLSISVRKRLPIILPTSDGAKLEEHFMIEVIIRHGNGFCYRFAGCRLIGSRIAYVVLLPKNYVYTNYNLLLPKTTGHYKRVKKMLFSGREVEVVKSRRLEDRVHIGPNFGLFHDPWEKREVLALYYVNPNRVSVDLDVCLDIQPITEENVSSCSQLRQVLEAHPENEKSNLIQQVINQAHSDLNNQSIRKAKEQVSSIEEAEAFLFLVSTKRLLRKLKRMGIEIERGGRHQYKAMNPKTGNTAPIPYRKELPHYFIKTICKQLQIEYDSLIEDP